MFSYSLSSFAPLAPLTLEFQTFKPFNRFAPFNSPTSFVLPRGRGGGQRRWGFERLEPFERFERPYLSQRSDLLHAGVEGYIFVLVRIPDDPDRISSLPNGINGFFDHVTQHDDALI